MRKLTLVLVIMWGMILGFISTLIFFMWDDWKKPYHVPPVIERPVIDTAETIEIPPQNVKEFQDKG